MDQHEWTLLTPRYGVHIIHTFIHSFTHSFIIIMSHQGMYMPCNSRRDLRPLHFCPRSCFYSFEFAEVSAKQSLRAKAFGCTVKLHTDMPKMLVVELLLLLLLLL